jgi:outer membrane protein
MMGVKPAFVLGILASALTMAASHGAENGGGFIGAGVSVTPDYEGGEDYEASPVLLGRYNFSRGRYIALERGADAARSARLALNLVSHSSWGMGPTLGVRYRRDNVDNSQVDKMDDIDWATEAGGFVSYQSGSLFATLGLSFDISDTYDGYIGDLTGGFKQEVTSRLGIIYSMSVAYVDDNYMDEYFGVDDSDSVRSGLPFYKADAGIKDFGLGISVDYSFTSVWGLISWFNYYRLTGDAEDSPIVDNEGSKNQLKAGLVLTYSF